MEFKGISIFQPLVGKSKHHIQNTSHFVKWIKDITLGLGECITSDDITALFSSVPESTALDIVQAKLEQDQDLHLRTELRVWHIIECLEFCLHNTYFLFQGKYYKQV